MKRALSLLLATVLLVALLPAASLAASPTFTLMVYLCGTDLESEGGLAAEDLREMVASDVAPGGKLTVYVQTGGTKSWSVSGLKDGAAQRWMLDSEGLTNLEDLGRADMGSGDTFAAFLRYGLATFPAERYGLIFWNHGAGASDGVCYDELTGNSLNMQEIREAFTAAAALPNYRTFALVGFDACLMADYEMAVHIAPFAQTMVASEETEPGEGWSYQSWLPTLARNTGIDMHTLGKQIVDSFIQSVERGSYGEFGTLSVIDLTRIDALHAAMERMAGSLSSEIEGGNFNALSRIRQKTPSFGQTSDDASDMIDLGVFASMFKHFDAEGAAQLADALADAVVYSRHTSNLNNISGLAVLVPYSTRESAAAYLPAYDAQNLMPAYAGFVRSFVGQMSGGSHSFATATVAQQSVQDATVDWFAQFATDTDSYYSAYSDLWGGQTAGTQTQGGAATAAPIAPAADDFSLDSFLNSLFGSEGETFNADAYASETAGSALGETTAAVSSASFAALWGGQSNPEAATVEVTAGGETYAVDNPFAGASGDYAYTVTLSAEDMQYLATAEASLMMDVSDPDFECYVDLGYTQDTIIDWNQNKIYGLFDGTWPTLDGQMVCIYDQIANETYVRSLIPVKLNGEETYLLVVFDDEHPGGVVVGASEGYNDAGQPVRGYDKISEGDVVIPQYDLIYWDENDEQQTMPFDSETAITVGMGGYIPFGYEAVEGEADYQYGFCLNDVYGGYEFTDFITLSF